MSFTTVLLQMCSLLIMIGVGALAALRGMWDRHTNEKISKMIINIFNPLLIITSASGAVGKISLSDMSIVLLIAAGMFLAFILLGMVLSPLFDKDREQQKVFQLMFVFSNLGYIGIPVVNSVLGPDYVVYVTEFILVFNAVFYTYGIALANGRFTAASLRSLISPGTVFCVLGLVLILAEIILPEFLLSAVRYLGNMTTPLALMSVGYSLTVSDLRKAFGNRKIYVFALLKLLVIPLFLFLILRLLPVDREILPVCMIMFGMPVANNTLMLCTDKGIDGTNCTSAILVTTLLCVACIPLLLAIALR